MAAAVKELKQARGAIAARNLTAAQLPRGGSIAPGFWLRVAVIVLTALWIYAPSLRGPWVWDDALLVTQNKVILDPAGWWKIWLQPGCMQDYQPLKYSVVWLQWRLWGADPLGYHVTNLVLHIGSALLVWRLLGKLGLRLAWLGGLIFAMHPLQVESVAWISELKNTLSLPPFLLAMGAYLDFDARGQRRDYWLALALFVVALLAKTTMIMFPFVILLHAWWKYGRVTRRDVVRSEPFFVVSLLFGLATLWERHQHGIDANTLAAMATAHPVGFLDRMVLTGLVIWFAIAKFVWPAGISLTYPLWKFEAASLLFYVPWLALAAWLFWCWQRRTAWGRSALLGSGFFLLNMVTPVAFLVAAYPDVVWSLDHLFYVPMIGLIGLAVAGVEWLDVKLAGPARLAWIVPSVGAMVLMALGSRSYATLFADPKALWAHTLREDPTSMVANMELGHILSDEGKLTEANERFRAVLQATPLYAKAHYNLANDLRQLGDTAGALAEFETSLKLDPGLSQARINVGLLLLEVGRGDEAVDQFAQAVKLAPDDAKARLGLANCLRNAGRLTEAETEYEQAVQLQPDLAEAHHGLACIYMQQAKAADALRECQAALALNPREGECYFIRGVLELFGGRNDAAEADLSQAIQLDPHFADAYFRRSTLLQMRGDLDPALADLEAGCRLAPKDSLADYARLSIWVVQAQLGRKADADRHLAAALAQSWNAGAGDWVTLVGRFLLGQEKEGDLLTAAARLSPPGSGVLTCEAWYFAGMKALGSGDRATAVADLQKCVATGQRNSIKFRLAQAQLAEMGAP
jgi:tetratricopeptide (TPR) repeat protein